MQIIIDYSKVSTTKKAHQDAYLTFFETNKTHDSLIKYFQSRKAESRKKMFKTLDYF